MTAESSAEVLIRKSGACSSMHSKIRWQGSINECWDFYVDKFKIKKENFIPKYKKYYDDKRTHYEVYMMVCQINNKEYIKIGISENSEVRMKGQKTSFPMGEWSLVKNVYVKNKEVAKTCEFNMLVSCSHLNIGGEWIFNENREAVFCG